MCRSGTIARCKTAANMQRGKQCNRVTLSARLTSIPARTVERASARMPTRTKSDDGVGRYMTKHANDGTRLPRLRGRAGALLGEQAELPIAFKPSHGFVAALCIARTAQHADEFNL